MYKLYNMNDLCYKHYIEDTKRGKDCDKETVERKLLAFMLCANEVKDNRLGCKIYKFGTFNIAVRDKSDDIGSVYWGDKKSYISKEKSAMLKEIYNILGLSEDGHSILKEIDKEALDKYCDKNKLSNTEEFKRNFFDLSFLGKEFKERKD